MTRPLIPLLVTALTFLSTGPGASADAIPSGERQLGQSFIEPAYNDGDGSLIYLLTPSKPAFLPKAPVTVHPNDHNVAPLYLMMYPTSASGAIGTVNCQHQPMDNCPDHGPLVSAIAEGLVPSISPGEPSVYPAGGVWGHDHLVAAPGSGGDFNILWLPVEVLFKPGTPITHVTKMSQLQPLIDGHLVDLIPLPPATFHCSVAPAATYNNGTPVPPVPGTP